MTICTTMGMERRRDTLMTLCREQVWNTLDCANIETAHDRIFTDKLAKGQDSPEEITIPCPATLEWQYEIWLRVLEQWLMDISSPRYDCAKTQQSMLRHWNEPLSFLTAIGLEESWVRKMALRGGLPRHPLERPVLVSKTDQILEVLTQGVQTDQAIRDATGLSQRDLWSLGGYLKKQGRIQRTTTSEGVKAWEISNERD